MSAFQVTCVTLVTLSFLSIQTLIQCLQIPLDVTKSSVYSRKGNSYQDGDQRLLGGVNSIQDIIQRQQRIKSFQDVIQPQHEVTNIPNLPTVQRYPGAYNLHGLAALRELQSLLAIAGSQSMYELQALGTLQMISQLKAIQDIQRSQSVQNLQTSYSPAAAHGRSVGPGLFGILPFLASANPTYYPLNGLGLPPFRYPFSIPPATEHSTSASHVQSNRKHKRSVHDGTVYG